MEAESLYSMIDKGGTIATAMVIIIALVRGWLVPRWHFDTLQKDRDEWREIALDSTGLAERAVTVAEPTVRQRRRRTTE